MPFIPISNLLPVQELAAAAHYSYDAVVIGSGPAGTAAAQALKEFHPNWAVAVVERGSAGLLTHTWNLAVTGARDALYYGQAVRPWMSDNQFFSEPICVLALGGRGSYWACSAPRFAAHEFEGKWPLTLADLEADYIVAEKWLSVTNQAIRGELQNWLELTLQSKGYDAKQGPIAVDITPTQNWVASTGFDSAAARLTRLGLIERLGSGQLHIVPNTFAFKLVQQAGQVQTLACIDTRSDIREIYYLHSRYFLLAAGTIESARLVLNSNLPYSRDITGGFLADHLFCQCTLEIRVKKSLLHPLNLARPPACGVLMRLPPEEISSDGWLAEIRDAWIDAPLDPEAATLKLWVRLFGPIEAQITNRVTIRASDRDEYGIPRAGACFQFGPDDIRRIARMKEILRGIAADLGVDLPEARIKLILPGDVNHEAGTLRMSTDYTMGVTDPMGRVRGISNLLVCDASLFPSSGVTNPCLTITALARRVVRHIEAV